MGTLTDITATANNTSLRNANAIRKPLTRPGDENSGKAKSPHFMSPTLSSAMQINAPSPKVSGDISSPTIVASNRKQGWMTSAVKRVGIHRGVRNSAKKGSSVMNKAIAIPDKLATPSPSNLPASSSPTLSHDAQTQACLSTKPLPSPPIAQISKSSPIKESRSLLDASEKPLRRSPPGRPQQEEDWPVLSPESVTAPKPVQDTRDSPYPITGKILEEKERYPAMTGLDLRPAHHEFSERRVVRKPVFSTDENHKSPQLSVAPVSEKLNAQGSVTTAMPSSVEAIQAIGSKTPPTSYLAAPTFAGSRGLSSNDRMLPHQTKTSELRARRSAGYDNKGKISAIAGGLGNPGQAVTRNFSPSNSQSPNIAFLSQNPLRDSSRASTNTSRVPTQFMAGTRRLVDNRSNARASLRNDAFRQPSVGLQAPIRASPAAHTSSCDNLLAAKTRIIPLPSVAYPTSIPLPNNVSINTANISAKTTTIPKDTRPGGKMEHRNEFDIYEDHSSAQDQVDAFEGNHTSSNCKFKIEADDQAPQAVTTPTSIQPPSSKFQHAINIIDQQVNQFAQLDHEIKQHSPVSVVCDSSTQDESSPVPLIVEKMLNDGTGPTYDGHDELADNKTHVKHLSAKAPSFGPTLRISPSAERWVMGNNSKVRRDPSPHTSKRSSLGTSTFTHAVHGLVDSAIPGKKQGDRPLSAQGLLHPSSTGTVACRGSTGKRAKSAEMGYSLSTDHLKARIVRSQSQTANRMYRSSNDTDPFLDTHPKLKEPQSDASLAKESSSRTYSCQHNVIAKESTTNAGTEKSSPQDLRLIIPDNRKNAPIPSVAHRPATAPLADAFKQVVETVKHDERPNVPIKSPKRNFSQVDGHSTPVQSRPFPPRTSSQATPPDFTVTKTTSNTLAPTPTNAQPTDVPTAAKETSVYPIRKGDSAATTSTSSKRASTISQSSTATKNAISNFRARIFHKRPVDKTPTPAAPTSRKVKRKLTTNTTGTRSTTTSHVTKPSPTTQTQAPIQSQLPHLEPPPDTPTLTSPAPNPIASSTSLILSLCDLAQRDPSSPHRSDILTLSTILAESVNHAREAQKAMETARLAANEAEGMWRLCVEAVRVLEGIVRGEVGVGGTRADALPAEMAAR